MDRREALKTIVVASSIGCIASVSSEVRAVEHEAIGLMTEEVFMARIKMMAYSILHEDAKQLGDVSVRGLYCGRHAQQPNVLLVRVMVEPYDPMRSTEATRNFNLYFKTLFAMCRPNMTVEEIADGLRFDAHLCDWDYV